MKDPLDYDYFDGIAEKIRAIPHHAQPDRLRSLNPDFYEELAEVIECLHAINNPDDWNTKPGYASRNIEESLLVMVEYIKDYRAQRF